MENTFIDVTRKIYGEMNNYGAIAKAAVEMVAEITPFQIKSVKSNTSATYGAFLSFPGYPYLIFMGNSNSNFQITLATNDEVLLTGTNALCSMGRDVEASGGDGNYIYYSNIRVVFSSVNGILNGIQINPGGGQFAGTMFSWAVSEHTGETIGFYSEFRSAGTTTYSHIGFLGYDAITTSVYNGGSAKITAKNQYASGVSLSEDAMDASCAWVPVRSIGYLEPSRWFGRLLWGGKYIMYCLTHVDLTSPISTTPGMDYVVDGKIYKAVFNELYDLRES